MLAAFVLSNPTVQSALFGEYFSSLLPGGLGNATEMPALEHLNGRCVPTPAISGNRRRTSSHGRISKRAESQLIFDDTFGIIRKDIIDSWSQPKKILADIDAPGSTSQPRGSLPPVRSVTLKAAVSGKKGKRERGKW